MSRTKKERMIVEGKDLEIVKPVDSVDHKFFDKDFHDRIEKLGKSQLNYCPNCGKKVEQTEQSCLRCHYDLESRRNENS